MIWELKNGPVKPGHIVIFIDGDRDNLSHDNLAMIKRSVAVRLNCRGYYQRFHNDLKPSVLALTKLEVKTRELENA